MRALTNDKMCYNEWKVKNKNTIKEVKDINVTLNKYYRHLIKLKNAVYLLNNMVSYNFLSPCLVDIK